MKDNKNYRPLTGHITLRRTLDDLNAEVFKAVNVMNNTCKHSVGGQLSTLCSMVSSELTLAYVSTDDDKIKHLKTLLAYLETIASHLLTALRIGSNLNRDKVTDVLTLCVDANVQVSKWLNTLAVRSAPDSNIQDDITQVSDAQVCA